MCKTRKSRRLLRSGLEIVSWLKHGLSSTTAWLEQLKKTVSASSHSYYSWVDILMSVLGQGSDTQPSLMIDPSEGQTAVVASAESSKQTCHRFYLRFHTFIHIQSRTRCKFVNVLQQILQCCQSIACVKGRPSKDRISRLWSLSPTALSAHLGTGARHFWEQDTFGYMFFCMFAFSYIFHDSIHVCISSFAVRYALRWYSMVQWLTSVRKCCNVLTYRSQLVNSSFVNWKVQRKPKTGAASRRHSSASGAWLLTAIVPGQTDIRIY